MSQCLKELGYPGEPYPGLERLLSEASRVLRSRLALGGSVSEWALYAIGAHRSPGPGCEASLEELGFYDLTGKSGVLRVAGSPLELVDETRPTPLVALRLPGAPRVWAKLEWFNPYSLSIKDRTAASLVKPIAGPGAGGIVEVSSSNTGIALASIAAALGMRALIVLPRGAPRENELLIRLLGAEVVRGEGSKTTDLLGLAVEAAARGMYWTDQFGNDLNLIAHTRGTGRELVVQLERGAGVRPSAIAVATGTSGTASGVMFAAYNYWRDDPPLFIVAQPAPGERIEGIRRAETGAKWLHAVRVPHVVVDVTRREALDAARLTARSSGLLPGPSGGAALAALLKSYESGLIDRSGDAAVVFPDSLVKYPWAVEEIVGGPA